jgi:hypothetical protein
MALTTHTHLSAKVERRVELYLCSPLWAFVAGYRVTFTFTVLTNNAHDFYDII